MVKAPCQRFRPLSIDESIGIDPSYFPHDPPHIVARIDGDYAWLNRTDAEEEPLFIARALLPEEIDEGTKLKYEMLQYEIL